jgi:hypothetical protein
VENKGCNRKLLLGAVVLTRTAATNLADLATHSLKLDYAALEPTLFALLIVTSLCRRSHTYHSIPSSRASKNTPGSLPNNDAQYWAMMLVASVIGTTLGDFTSDNLGLGVEKASIILALVLTGIFYLQNKFDLFGRAAGYWIMLVAVRTAGTVMGDFLSGEEGLGLGFMVSAACATFLLVGAKTPDLAVARLLKLPSGSITVMDRAYIDFTWFEALDKNDRFFVTRMKRGIRCKVVAWINSQALQQRGKGEIRKRCQ